MTLSQDHGSIAEKPGGTVTFVFTDIEGSTQLVRELGGGYGAVQADHRRLIRSAFGANGGEEVDTQGDSFLYVFPRARNAALAAADAQRSLAAHDWPDGAQLRVRMGMHTAEPSVSEAGYHGVGVHRAARIMAAGHGGQILASQATASVLADERVPQVEVRDLGEQKLKDIDRPERIFQLDVAGLPTRFPRLRTAAPALYRRPRTIAVAAAVLASAVAVSALALGQRSDGSGGLARVSDNAVGVVDTDSQAIIGEALDIPSPGALTAGADSVWATSSKGGGSVLRIDPDTHEVQDTIQVGNGPQGIAFGAGDVWVANGLDGTVSRIDGDTGEVSEPIRVGNTPTAIAFGAEAVWVANTDDGTVSKLDPRSGEVLDTLKPEVAASGIAVVAGAIWLTDRTRNQLVRIDATSGDVTDPVPVGSGPTAVTHDGASLWVANSLAGTVSRVDARLARAVSLVRVPANPSGIAVTGDAVWITAASGGLVRLDRRTGKRSQIQLGGRPNGVLAFDGRLWVAVQASGASHRGGTLRLLAHPENVVSLDPAKAYGTYAWMLLAATHDGLVGFKRVGGADGNTLVPDLASALPTPTDGGKTYTFRLRPGIRFSNGRPLRASDVRASFERMFRAKSPRRDFYEVIVGGRACVRRPRSCDLAAGVVADDATGVVTFKLRSPDAEFLHKLALPFASALPAGTPLRAQTFPGTGPYRIAGHQAGKLVRLKRNSRFRLWSRAAQPGGVVNEIVVTHSKDLRRHVEAVARNRADALAAFPSPDSMERVRTRYPGQVHITPAAGTSAVILNINRAPFSNPWARQAVAYALDRNSFATRLGGPNVAAPTCQILPPNFPAYKPYCPYTLQPSESGQWTGPDMRRAHALIDRSGTHGMWVDVRGLAGPFARLADLLAATLRRLGYRVRTQFAPDVNAFYAGYAASAAWSEATYTGWDQDYPAPSNFFGGLASCKSSAYTCRPETERRIRRGLELQRSNARAAIRYWTALDQYLVSRAGIVPFSNGNIVDFVSSRLGNYQAHPVFGMLISQVWVDAEPLHSRAR